MQAGAIGAYHKNLSSRKKSLLGECRKNGRTARLIFTREFLRDSQAIGAVVPSSPFPARRMASLVPPSSGPVLGTGSGDGARYCGAPGKWHKASGTKLGGTLATSRPVFVPSFSGRRSPARGCCRSSDPASQPRCGTRGGVLNLPLRSMP